MKKRLIAAVLMISTAISLVACTSSGSVDADGNSEVELIDDIKNEANYVTIFENYGITLSVDVNNITYDGSQLCMDISAINNCFEQFNVGIESITLNGDSKCVDKMYFGEKLGSGIVSDNIPKGFNNRRAIIITKGDIGTITKIDINFVFFNEEQSITLVTSGASIELNDKQYVVTETTTLNEDKSMSDWDSDLDVLESRIDVNELTEYTVFGTHLLGYVATDKLSDLTALIYNDYEYFVSDGNIDIHVSNNTHTEISSLYDMYKNECDNIMDKKAAVFSEYSFEDAEVKLLNTFGNDGYIKYTLLMQKTGVEDTIELNISTYTCEVEKFNEVVTDLITSYTLTDLRGVEI